MTDYEIPLFCEVLACSREPDVIVETKNGETYWCLKHASKLEKAKSKLRGKSA